RASALPRPPVRSSTTWPSPGPSTAASRASSPMSMVCRARIMARGGSTPSIASRNADELHAAVRQLEAVIAQVLDPVTDRQAVGHDRLAEAATVGLEGGLLVFMHGIDPTFGVTCVELADQYCCHLSENL